MIDTADVVVIGAGAYGASVAYHLARSGDRRVVVVDKGEPVSQTTPRAAGLSSCVQQTELLSRMATASVRAIERFEEETGESFVWHQPGSLKLARTEEHAHRLRIEVDRARASGIDVTLVDANRIRELTSFVDPGPVVAANGADAVAATPSGGHAAPADSHAASKTT